MAISKAQMKATAKYMKNNYDEIKIRVPKGDRAVIKAHADDHGESVNEFIKRAISEAIQKDKQE